MVKLTFANRHERLFGSAQQEERRRRLVRTLDKHRGDYGSYIVVIERAEMWSRWTGRQARMSLVDWVGYDRPSALSYHYMDPSELEELPRWTRDRCIVCVESTDRFTRRWRNRLRELVFARRGGRASSRLNKRMLVTTSAKSLDASCEIQYEFEESHHH